MRRYRGQSGGQVLVMVTLSLFVLCGMLGLAVDLGIGYFTKKSAQAAADAAALAAAHQALAVAGEGTSSYSCESTSELACSLRSCVPPIPGPPTDNLNYGCLYAQANGFVTKGRQTVTLEAGAWNGTTKASPPTVPGLQVYYWVTARVSQRIPQLFSAMLGNTEGAVGARATAVVTDIDLFGNFILLNRENDPLPAGVGPTGADLIGGGNSMIYGGEGIVLSSAAHGSPYAGESQSGSGGGTVTVTAPMTFIRSTGEVNPTIDWRSTIPGAPAWQNGFQDRSYFRDPLRKRGQPPPPTGLLNASTDFPVLNGNIVGSDDPNNPRLLKPGYYYAVSNGGAATADRLTISGYVRFSAAGDPAATTIPATTPPAAWSDFVFFGGVFFQTNANVKFDPGRYIFAGTKYKNLNLQPEVFSFSNQVILEDHTPLSADGVSQPNKPGDAGELLIFTDANYVGWNPLTKSYVPLEIPDRVRPVRGKFQFGTASMQAGANSSTFINLHALNNDPADTVGFGNVPPELGTFRPVLLWQDQFNSRVRYTGYPEASPSFDVDYRTSTCTTGIDGLSAPTINNPCPQTIAHPESPEMRLQATPNTHLYGAVYQPRGAWMVLQGSGTMNSPLQLVSGALAVQGGPTVTLLGLANGLDKRMAVLAE